MKSRYFRLISVILIVFLINICIATSVGFAAVSYTVRPDYGITVNGVRLTLERDPVVVNGRTLAPARTVFERTGIITQWRADTSELTMYTSRSKLVMKIGSTRAVFNSVPLITDSYPVLIGGVVLVPVRFICEMFKLTLNWDSASKTVSITGKAEILPGSRGDDRKIRLVIDPGHGGSDPGANYYGQVEKTFNLDIALRLADLLRDSDIDVIMTRTDDSYVDLYTRARIANNAKADLFVGIHNNAGYLRDSGTMSLYYPSNKNNIGKILASNLQQTLIASLGTANMGLIPRPNLVVLRETQMPAAIVEVCYLTNKNDIERLKTSSFRQQAAEAIKTAIMKTVRSIWG